jgi:hypothetical protein
MEESAFKEIIGRYGLNSEDIYSDLSVLGLVLFFDRRQDLSIAIECHKSSNIPMVLFNKRDKGKIYSLSKPLKYFTEGTLQSLKNGNVKFARKRLLLKSEFSVEVYVNSNELLYTVSKSGT